jgi:hypothetical protein
LDNLGIDINYLFPDEEGLFEHFNFLSYEKYYFDGIKELYENKNYEKAIDNFKIAIEIKTDFVGAYFN